jgi:intraflagellar transport protein 122
MKASQLWIDKVRQNDATKTCIWDMCFSADGLTVIVGVNNRVQVYDANTGDLLQTLKGHKDSVFCVTASAGGFSASGSADKSVIVWKDFTGQLQYLHGDAVQCLSFNPVTGTLLSCAVSDFGLWIHGQKNIIKTKVNSRITSCSWTNDGQYFALGLHSGVVSIRNMTGEELKKIERPGPVWSLEWCPNKNDSHDILAVADWSQKLSLYHISGKQVGKDKQLDFDPCRVSWFPKGDYLMISGSSKCCNIYSRDGIHLSKIVELPSWIWCTRIRQQGNICFMGSCCDDGTLAVHTLISPSVNSIYRDRYAYREGMTDIVVHNLVTNQRVKIQCRELIRKVAVYKKRLAVLLPDKFIVHELLTDDPNDMQYKQKEKCMKKLDNVGMFLVCANSIVICVEKRIQCLSFQGVKEREWVMEHPVRYVKVIGGPPSREGLLLGLRNGQILEIFLDNPFPIQILKLNVSARCVDLSASRRKLAVSDEHGTCLVYSVQTKELLYQEPNAMSVAWNTELDDMLCFNGNGLLNIKAGNFPVHQQKFEGFAVGFSGSSVFCLHNNEVTTVTVPLSAPMFQYLEKKMFSEAHNVACLGVANSDWEALAQDALEALDFETAKMAFIRVRELRYLDLIADLEERKRHGDANLQLFLGDIYAVQGKYADAARIYKKSGQPSRALTMYTDLRMFDLAKEFVGADDVVEKRMLISKQADWASNLNEPRSAAEMYISVGEYVKAIEIIGDHGWADMLIDLARKLDKADREALSKCGIYLQKLEQYAYASEVYHKMGDMKALVLLYIEAKNWDEAFALAKSHPEFRNDVYLPYAQFLAENDKFEEAQQAFHQAGMRDQAVKVLEQLTHNAVVESRFNDAGYYYWKLSMQCLDLAATDEDPAKVDDLLGKFRDYQHRAEMYYVYHAIQRFTDEPFTSHEPDAIFHMSKFLTHCLLAETPVGISKVNTLYALAKQSRRLGAYKVARDAFQKLHMLRIPLVMQEAVDVGSLTIRAKPFHDADDLLPMCYRCSTTNPLLNSQGNQCVNCRQPFVFSFVAFEILPLVEFFIDESITDVEAVSLLELEPVKKDKGKYKETRSSLAGQSWQTSDDYSLVDDLQNDDDPFASKFMSFEQGGGEFQPVVANHNVLRSLSRTEVIVCTWPKPMRNQYFKIIMPDVSITHCNSCNKMFHKDDYELLALQLGHCPFCRKSIDE